MPVHRVEAVLHSTAHTWVTNGAFKCKCRRLQVCVLDHLVCWGGAGILALIENKSNRSCTSIRIQRWALESGFNVACIVEEVNVDKVIHQTAQLPACPTVTLACKIGLQRLSDTHTYIFVNAPHLYHLKIRHAEPLHYYQILLRTG